MGGARQPVSRQRYGKRHDEQTRQRHADEDGTDDDAADVQDQDGRGADAHKNDGVHDPFDNHRPKRRATADPLAVAQVVAPHQFSETGRKNVVGEVPNEHVAGEAPQWDRPDGRDQTLPAECPETQVGDTRRNGESQPLNPGAAEQPGGLAQVHAPEHEIDAGEGNRDSDGAPGQGTGKTPHCGRGFRATSFPERRTRTRCRRNRRTTLRVDSPYTTLRLNPTELASSKYLVGTAISPIRIPQATA